MNKTNEELAESIIKGDNSLLWDLYERNEYIIKKYCKGFYEAYKSKCKQCGIEMEDLLNESIFVLLKCCESWNKQNDSNYKLTTFFKYQFQSHFIRLLKNDALNKCDSLEKVVYSKEGEEICLKDIIEDEKANFEDDLINELTNVDFHTLLGKTLNPEEYQLLYLKYYKKMTYSAIAKKAGKTESYVIYQIQKALKELKRKISQFKEDIITATFHNSNLSFFKKTNTSSVEWAVMQLEKRNLP